MDILTFLRRIGMSLSRLGGTIVGSQRCSAGSDNFSWAAPRSQPATWLGGTIEGPYVHTMSLGGMVVIEDQFNWNGGFFAPGTHIIFTGAPVSGPFRLTFTNPVASVRLDAQSNQQSLHTQTLKAYDSSNSLVATSAVAALRALSHLSVALVMEKIKYITVETTDPHGLGFSNVVWGCAPPPYDEQAAKLTAVRFV